MSYFDPFMAPITHGESTIYTGTGAPPPAPPTGGGGRRYYKPKVVVQRRKLSPRVLQLIKKWLELELETE